MTTTWAMVAMALGGACTGGGGDEPDELVDPLAGQFDCSSVEGTPGLLFCEDFNEGLAPEWLPESGSWRVQEGHYFGSGPGTSPSGICTASEMNATVRGGVLAKDVLLYAEMTSHARADKTLVLREVDPANRVELNFRAAPFDDLMVQELRDCSQILYTDEGEIPVPHEEGQTIEVSARLVGQTLVVTVDGAEILNRDFPFADSEGRLGVAVITAGSLTAFDSIWAQEQP